MKKLVAFSMVVMIVLGVWAVAAFAAEPAAKPKVLGPGDKMENFTLTDGLAGSKVSLEKDFLGKSKLLAVSFMNTSCTACNAEIRLLSQLADKHPDLKVVAVAVDARGEAVVKSYNEHKKWNVTYVLDPEYTQPPKYGFNYTPALVLADKSGKILMVKGGFNPITEADELAASIESKLK